ncbi:MAG: hypothetical protein P4M09_14490 [Devosia sp.]|nr:hypothetical protein [Devosia sp.]
MPRTPYRDDVIPQDTADDESSPETGTAQPLSEAEIEELLYGEGRSTEDRLTLLRQLRDDLVGREGGNVGDNDPEPLIQEIEDRIAELEGDAGRGGEQIVLDVDPLAHRETLSPDSDELDELEEEDEDSLDEEDDWLDAEDEGGGGKEPK